MSAQTFQDVLIDVDALLEGLRNLPEANEYRAEPGSAHLANELHAIYSGFIGQFFKPDIIIYVALQNWLITLIEPGLCTAGHRKQVCLPLIILYKRFTICMIDRRNLGGMCFIMACTYVDLKLIV